ncbi:MAG: DNA-directed RNA polymerase subunit beta' [Eubacteriales bacterium]|nr:DNA-directed RNA polymerase subunit beta' [Eubacteriales bacterium]
MFELNNFDAMQIGLASPEKIREWSHGEVKKPETINYRTLKPERDGLFCERIFGPTKDWECHCGKYKRIRHKGIICDKCGVEVTRAKVRRERMSHIDLAAPVSHIWYFRAIPSKMGLLVDIPLKSLEKVLYFAAFIVTDPGETGLQYKQVLTEKEYHDAVETYGADAFKAGMGAEAIKVLLKQIDLQKLCDELRKEVVEGTGQKKLRAIKRLDVAASFLKSGNKPEWMILDAVPILPPDLRPMVQLDGGRFATSDLNDLYRRVINRNNRLKRLMELNAPDIIVRNEKRMLQEAVDALIDNGRRGRSVTGPGNRPLKSLSDMLRGKQGRFRQNLLGKRVDYSGRSVIVVGPNLKLSQCGLPKEMALELFKPFVMKKLVEQGSAQNIKSARNMVDRAKPEVWDVLEGVIKDHPVLLNRAPTLHRLGIQAFEPVLVEGRALKLHPLACTAYNADFDGDQMAIHVPLSLEAQSEARFLMLAANNILKPQDGKPVISPTQDMVIGSYYLTMVGKMKTDENGNELPLQSFISPEEAIMAYQLGKIDMSRISEGLSQLHVPIMVRFTKEIDGKPMQKTLRTTVGRILFNENIPQDLGFVDRSDPENAFKLEIDFNVKKKDINKIVDYCYRKHGPTITADVLDEIKALGFKYSTKGSITVGVSDVTVPAEKAEILRGAEEEVRNIEKNFRRGLLSEDERYEQVIRTWDKAKDDVAAVLQKHLDKYNPIYMMSDSGARGSFKQINQLAGMRGLMGSPSGRIFEMPVRANFREGLSVLEFFFSSHGTRKGLADTALRTADSGYLTRRLVDVSQEVIINEDDCFAASGEQPKGVLVERRKYAEESEFGERLLGRVTIGDIVDPTTGEIIVADNQLINSDAVRRIVSLPIDSVTIRTILTCRAKHGVCAKCYGSNLSTGNEYMVDIGEAVGIVAAQSIGEPGTQLTMRTFHTGGVAGDDITQGLPRVQELFEARKPKNCAVISEIAGNYELIETAKKREIVIKGDDGETKVYPITYAQKPRFNNGDHIEAGDVLTAGALNPQDILKIMGVKGVQEYLLNEVRGVYKMQAVDISYKHVEVIIRQMLRKVRIEDAGDTDLLPSELIDLNTFEEINDRVVAEGGRPAIAKRVLLGITKASLATNSFLSAASFQETTRVLTDAAINGKIDPLAGLKENVIIGKLIPAGTGMKCYQVKEPFRKIQPTETENVFSPTEENA